MAKPWRVVLAAAAEGDLLRILAYTRETYGSRREADYEETILRALSELDNGPEVLGSFARDTLGRGVRSMHVARHDRRGRRFIIYRTRDERIIDVIRILHDAMDLARHIPPDPA